MDQFTIDPEFRDLLPPLCGDEYQRLQADINKNGCRDKLVVWKEWNILLDGHNRHEICTQLDTPYETTELSFPGRDEAKVWMIRNQLSRRNLTDAKRAALTLLLKPVLAAQAKEKMASGGGDHGNQHTGGKVAGCQNSDNPPEVLNTLNDIAKASGVSRDTVHRVEKVMALADESTKSKMLAGEISINKAYQTVKAPKPTAVAAATAPAPEKQPAVTEAELRPIAGVGIDRASEALAALKKIPIDDGLRVSAFVEVVKWIERNCEEPVCRCRRGSESGEIASPTETTLSDREIKLRGKSIQAAHDAIAALKRMYRGQPLRQRAFEMVRAFMDANP